MNFSFLFSYGSYPRPRSRTKRSARTQTKIIICCCEVLGRTLMILILTNQAVFVTLSVVKIPPLAQPSLF